MAKRASKSTTEQKIEEFAEDLGRLLGTARAKAEGWLSQRQQITKHLEDIRNTATHLLQQLGQGAVGLTRRAGRPARRGVGRPKGSGRKRRRMSAGARAKISAAQKKRWAKVKAREK